MFKKIVSLLVVAGLIFTGGYFTALTLLPDSSEGDTGPVFVTKPVERGDINVGVTLAGQLNANSGGRVSAPRPEGVDGSISYVVDEFFVGENDSVKEGDPIAQLSSPDLPDLVAEKESELQKIYDEIAELYEDIDEAVDSLGRKINKDISSVGEVNTSEGIVISAPISGRLTELSLEEGDKVEDTFIANIINDNMLEISFSCSVNEYTLLEEGANVWVTFAGFEGYYEGKISDLNPNRVPNEAGTTFIHNGTIEMENPGLIKVGATVGISTDLNGNVGKTLTSTGSVNSYGEESRIFLTGFTLNDEKTYLATEVFVNDNEFVEAGDPIVRIAGSDVSADIEADINDIKTIEDSIADKQDEVDNKNKEIMELRELESNLLIKSPSDGVISWQRYYEGDTIPNVSGNTDEWELMLVNLENSNDMIIYTQVSDLDVNYVKEGASVDVTVDAMPGETFVGTVERMYQYSMGGDEGVSYEVQISVVGGEGLRSGMNASCFVDAGESLGTLIVPIEAVYENDLKQMVEVLDENGVLSEVEIEIGLINDRYVEVLSGLTEGQNVVTGSSGDLLPSQSVSNDNSLLPTN